MAKAWWDADPPAETATAGASASWWDADPPAAPPAEPVEAAPAPAVEGPEVVGRVPQGVGESTRGVDARIMGMNRPQSAVSSLRQGTYGVASAIPKIAGIAQGAITGEDPRETALYGAGESLQDFSREQFPTHPEYAGEFWSGKVPQGLGSTLGFLAGGAVAGPGAAGLGATAGLGAAAGGAELFEDALEHGASLEDAIEASGWGAALGTSEAVPIGFMLNRFDRGSGGAIRRVLRDALVGGTEEAAQEAASSIGQNLIASDVVEYDVGRGMYRGVGDDAGVGFTVGGLFNFVASLAGGRRGGVVRPEVAREDESDVEIPEEPAPERVESRVEPAPEAVESRREAAPQAPPPPVEEAFGARFVEPVSAQAEMVEQAAQEADPEPTEAQAEAGNYRKGHVRLQGLDISIETPRGQTRQGWNTPMPAHYGYVRGSEGKDGDHVDVFVADDPASERVFVVDQIDPETGKFDEHKAVLGARTREEAESVYLGAYDDDARPRMGAMTEMPMRDFKAWLSRDGARRAPLAYKPKAPEPEIIAGTPEPRGQMVETQRAQVTPPEMEVPVAAPERAQEPAQEAPEQREESWLETLNAPEQQQVFSVMRDLFAQSERLYAESRPRDARLAVGSMGEDAAQRAEAIDAVLREVRKGASPEQAAEIAKAKLREVIARHNERRAGDVNWSRDEASQDVRVDRIAQRIAEAAQRQEAPHAAPAPEPAAEPIAAPEAQEAAPPPKRKRAAKPRAGKEEPAPDSEPLTSMAPQTEATPTEGRPERHPAWRESLTPKAAPQADELAGFLEQLVRTINPDPDLRVEFVDSMRASGESVARHGADPTKTYEALGVYMPVRHLVALSLSPTKPERVDAAAHEAWHSIERLLTPQERQVLRDAYPTQNGEAHIERTAEAFGAWTAGKLTAKPKPTVRRVFAKVREFLRRLRNWLNARGFQTVDDVFGKGFEGEVGARHASRPAGRTTVDPDTGAVRPLRGRGAEAASIRPEDAEALERSPALRSIIENMGAAP